MTAAPVRSRTWVRQGNDIPALADSTPAALMQLHAEEFARNLGNRHAFRVCHRISIGL